MNIRIMQVAGARGALSIDGTVGGSDDSGGWGGVSRLSTRRLGLRSSRSTSREWACPSTTGGRQGVRAHVWRLLTRCAGCDRISLQVGFRGGDLPLAGCGRAVTRLDHGQGTGWTGDQAAITLRQLLSFTSGLAPENQCTYDGTGHSQRVCCDDSANRPHSSSQGRASTTVRASRGRRPNGGARHRATLERNFRHTAARSARVAGRHRVLTQIPSKLPAPTTRCWQGACACL